MNEDREHIRADIEESAVFSPWRKYRSQCESRPCMSCYGVGWLLVGCCTPLPSLTLFSSSNPEKKSDYSIGLLVPSWVYSTSSHGLQERRS